MTTAVRTGGPGAGGVSVLVIETNSPGLTMRKIKNSGQNASNSQWVALENVKVPVENLIGKENQGFPTLMTSMLLNLPFSPFCRERERERERTKFWKTTYRRNSQLPLSDLSERRIRIRLRPPNIRQTADIPSNHPSEAGNDCAICRGSLGLDRAACLPCQGEQWCH